MRISCFLAFCALFLSVGIADTGTPNSPEEVTTEEPTTSRNVSSTPGKKIEEQEFKESEDSDKSRNVRATKGISSFPSFSAANLWAPVETFDKTPIFFEHSLADEEKLKLVIIEPFLQVKKVQKGFRGWMQKIFSENKEKKKGTGPLLGPIKVPGLGEHVYIRAVEPIENESERIVIHLKTNEHALGSSEKGIKLPNSLSLGNSLGGFDTLHGLPIESSHIHTIYAPNFSSGEVDDLFDKPHLSASDPSWMTFGLPPVSFPSKTEDIFSNPSFFRKHSTEAEGSAFFGSLLKDAEGPQENADWAPSFGSASSYGINEDTELGHGFFVSKNNQKVSSARDDIDKFQGVQNSQLEISQETESLPLYPPLFNGSSELSISNENEQLHVANSRRNKNDGSSSQYSVHRPGLGAYRTQSEIITSENSNIDDEKLQEKYINHDGIREVEAPNLYQGKNRGTYQYREENWDQEENVEQAKSDTKDIENSKKVRISQPSDYGNDKIEDSNSAKMNNGTTEIVKQLYATYPWTDRLSKGRDAIAKASENEERGKKESTESSISNSQVQTQSESRRASLQRSKSRFTVDGNLKKVVRNNSSLRKRSKDNSEIQNLLNETSENKNVAADNSSIEIDTSAAISEIDIYDSNNYTKLLESKEKSRVNDSYCSEEDDLKCTQAEREESTKKEMKVKVTAKDLKKFFIEESKRFEDVLKTVEEESRDNQEETKSIAKELNPSKEDIKAVERSVKKEIKSATGESKSLKEDKSSQSGKTTTVSTFKTNTEKSNEKVYVVTPSNRFTTRINRTRLDRRTNKSYEEVKEGMRKTNSSIRAEIRKPNILASRPPIIDGRFNRKLKNNTNSVKQNTTVNMEIPKTTPPTHISRIYAKNRFNDRLKSNLKEPKSEEKDEKDVKAKKEEKKSETEKSLGVRSKEDKQKEQLHMRMAKLFPKAHDNKLKNEAVTIEKIEEEA
ncbi:trichohyalin-like [Belonocnema kinseyi]|uniref:trichohyalin-like n=1 Tax=Belonocnema kinseyi TaxID=2817044 RepID=UPI00143D4F83|nr:trichohyalin-like [Belonocnema kinseyi]